jgi:hypothetical protein
MTTTGWVIQSLKLSSCAGMHGSDLGQREATKASAARCRGVRSHTHRRATVTEIQEAFASRLNRGSDERTELATRDIHLMDVSQWPRSELITPPSRMTLAATSSDYLLGPYFKSRPCEA